MQPDIRKAALRAAAKLAFSVTLVGCAAHDPSGDTTNEANTDTANQEVRRHHPTTHAGVCGTTDGGNPDTYAKDCCESLVHASFTKTGTRKTSGPALADTKACCGALATFHDHDPATMWSWPERSECCTTLGWSGAATCTPWGPPVPPPMRRRGAARPATLGVA